MTTIPEALWEGLIWPFEPAGGAIAKALGWDKKTEWNWQDITGADIDGIDAREYRARRGATLLGLMALLVAAPAVYAGYLAVKKRKKGNKGISDKEAMVGMSIENSSSQFTNLGLTAIAAPAIALPLGYWLIELMENYPPRKVLTVNDYSARNAAVDAAEVQFRASMAAAATIQVTDPAAYWAMAKTIRETYDLALAQANAIPPVMHEQMTPPGVISGHFGDSLQALLTATVAAPAIGAGIQLANSAFKARTAK